MVLVVSVKGCVCTTYICSSVFVLVIFLKSDTIVTFKILRQKVVNAKRGIKITRAETWQKKVCNMQLEAIQYIKLYQTFMERKPKPYMRAYKLQISILQISLVSHLLYPGQKLCGGAFLKFIIPCIIPKCFKKTISWSKKVVKTALRLLTVEKNW